MKNKEDFKVTKQIILTRLLGALIPLILFAIYLFVNNIFSDFMYYAVYGVKTFTNNIPYINLIVFENVVIKILAILMPICIIVMYIKSIVLEIKSQEQKNLFIIFAYSVAGFIVCFPISDGVHFTIAIVPTMLGLMYMICNFILDKYKKERYRKIITNIKEYLETVVKFYILCIFIIAPLMIFAYIMDANKYKELNHFKYINTPSDLVDYVKTIDEYIKKEESAGNIVYILDAEAAISMIPLDRYNKDYDMFLVGNLGADGEEGQIEKLKNMEENVILLIKNENILRNWQNPEKVRNYIINNWVKIDEIECFDVYMKGI